MASAETPLSVVAEWKRKACDFTEESTDSLPSVFLRTLEAISIILKNPTQSHIQRALASIEFDLSNCLRFEETNEPSIRSLMFGLIEALHLTLNHVMDGRCELNDKDISTIQEWKKKSADFSNGSSDLLASVISRAFDAMFIIIKNSDLISILRALGSLNFDRLQSEKIEGFSIRSLMYGMIESIYVTLLHLTEKKNQPKSSEDISNKEKPIPINAASSEPSDIESTHSLDQLSTTPTFTKSSQLVPKEEPLDSSESTIGKNEFMPLEEEIKEELIDFSLFNQPLCLDFTGDNVKKEEIMDDDSKEPTDKFIDAPLSDVNQLNLEFIDEFKDEPLLDEDMGNDIGNSNPIGDDLFDNREGEESNDTEDKNYVAGDAIEVGGENEIIENTADITKDSSETVEMEKRRRSSRNVSKSVKYSESMDESDEEDEPSMKKKRLESVEKIEKKSKSVSKSMKKDNVEKDNDTEKKELECPECEYRSRSVDAWEKHLRRVHSTNPTLAGCLLRCDCGNESYSKGHSFKCEISNFTVIRILTDPLAAPQCVMCEIRPKTLRGYIDHLRIHHKTTLLATGIYLKCACGFKCGTRRSHMNHDKKCNGRDFTLHKLDED